LPQADAAWTVEIVIVAFVAWLEIAETAAVVASGPAFASAIVVESSSSSSISQQTVYHPPFHFQMKL
jgi:hypothetical protein